MYYVYQLHFPALKEWPYVEGVLWCPVAQSPPGHQSYILQDTPCVGCMCPPVLVLQVHWWVRLVPGRAGWEVWPQLLWAYGAGPPEQEPLWRNTSAGKGCWPGGVEWEPLDGRLTFLISFTAWETFLRSNLKVACIHKKQLRSSWFIESFSTSTLLYLGLNNSLWTGRGCSPVYCQMFNRIPGLYPIGANSTPFPSCDKQKYLQTLPNVPWEKNCPLLIE